jgi:hypothetical protein
MSGSAPIRRTIDRQGSLKQVLAAWNDLSSSARYFFQTGAWIELLATRASSDVIWHVTPRSGRAIFVSILRRRLLWLGATRLRILTSFRPVPQMPPFAESLVDSAAVA